MKKFNVKKLSDNSTEMVSGGVDFEDGCFLTLVISAPVGLLTSAATLGCHLVSEKARAKGDRQTEKNCALARNICGIATVAAAGVGTAGMAVGFIAEAVSK